MQLFKESSPVTRDTGQRARPCHVFQVSGSSLPVHLTATVQAGHTCSKLATTQSSRFGRVAALTIAPGRERAASQLTAAPGHNVSTLHHWQAHAPGSIPDNWQADGKAARATGSPVPRFWQGWEPNTPATFGDGSNDRTTASWPTSKKRIIGRAWQQRPQRNG